jgi:acyl dehydratase
MLNTKTETTRTVTARVGKDPRFDGSIHDDQSAKKFGFQSALVPGPTVASYMTHLFVEAWSEQWLRQGAMTERNRRPVYDGETVTATATPIAASASGLSADVVLRNAQRDEVAFATGAMPDRIAPPPDLALFPHRPHLAETPTVTAGGHKPGDFFRSTEMIYTQAIHDDFLAKIGETLPIFAKDGVVHPDYLVGYTIREAIQSYIKPTPGIHVSYISQHFNLAHVGDVISTSGQIINAYEKKGSHYMQSDQLVIANHKTPIALFRRTSIYAVRAAAA